ncbi:MAG TPA: ankyrin repeat domain-containing protein [Caulobacteraceae bacterium]|nr:ankyrin repeat domain-containing protein [Caulobacteraceae bacterium]
MLARALGLIGVCIALLGAAAPRADAADCDLCKSAEAGDLAQAALLLQDGAAVDGRDAAGFTPLAYAMTASHFDLALYLLDKGARADVALPNSDKTRPLSLALIGGDLALTHRLIAAGAAVNGPPAPAYTPLMYAASAHRPDLVQVLLDAHADLKLKNEQDRTALDEAIPAWPTNNAAATADDIARLQAAMPTIKLLLAAGSPVNNHWPHEAAWHWMQAGQPDLLDLFLAYGMNPDGYDDHLMLDAVHADALRAARLVDEGASPDLGDVDDANTSLNLAVMRGDIDQTRLMLDLGADVENHGADGQTPVGRALLDKNEALFKLLLDRGADLAAAAGKTPDDPLTEEQFFKDNPDYPQGAIRDEVRAFLSARGRLVSAYARLDWSQQPATDPKADKVDKLVFAQMPKASDLTTAGYLELVSDAAPCLAAPTYQYDLRLLAASLPEPPPTPEAARRHEAAGLALYQSARSRSGLLAAAVEYERAAQAAPWIAAYHRDICLLTYAAGFYHLGWMHCVMYVVDKPSDFQKFEAIIRTENKTLDQPDDSDESDK